MRPGRRFGLSVEQKLDVWRRWKAGQTLHEIGRAFGKDHNSIRGIVARHGGIVPAVRRRGLWRRLVNGGVSKKDLTEPASLEMFGNLTYRHVAESVAL